MAISGHHHAGPAAVLASVRDQVAEVEARQIAKKQLHYASTGDWVTHIGGLRRGEGKRIVDRAVALTGPLTHTREQMLAGVVSPAQAEVIAKTMADLPGAPHLRGRAEATLLDNATRLDATELGRTARHLVSVVDPGGEERTLEALLDRDERAAHVGRFLAITDDGAGG